MASPKQIIVKEPMAVLRKLQKTSIPMIALRIRALIEFKKHEEVGGISKRAAAEAIGANHNSVQTWRKLYLNGGLDALLNYTKNEGRPSCITEEEHKQIEIKLKNPKNGLRGYVELKAWMEDEFNKIIKYNTLLKYSMRHFGSKVKVARKSHVKKDETAVEMFKKNSPKPAKKSAKQNRNIKP